MVPQPKRKLSKGRRDRRRSQDALNSVQLVQCSNCGEMHLPHTVCPNCGYYQGREVISVKEKKKKIVIGIGRPEDSPVFFFMELVVE